VWVAGLINQFLSAKLFLVLSRLCFIVYLVHPMVIWVVYSSHGSLIYFQDVTIVSNPFVIRFLLG
jgi:hypothetical protein